MQRIRSGQKYITSILLMLGVCFFFFFAMAFPVHAETSAEPSTKINGYVSDLKIRAAFNLATDIPGFVFDPAKTTYSDDDELVLYNGVAPKIIASVTEDDLYYQICINGVPKGNPQSIKGQNASVGNVGSMTAITGASCGKNSFSIEVGKVSSDKKTFTVSDKYTFYYVLKPTLTTPTLTDTDGNKISVSPEYTSGIWYFHDTYVSFSSADKIVFSGKFKTANTKCYLDNGTNTVEYTSGQKVELNLANYREADSSIAKIPVRLVCDDGTETTSYFYIIDSEKVVTITRQPQSTSCDKLATPTLSIEATTTGEEELSYQWFYDGNGGLGGNLKAIPGATSNTYTLPKSVTKKANRLYYQCEVTSTLTINGESYTFTEKSDKVTVDVQLSYVSKPTIVRELGSFYSTTGSDLFVGDYKEEYTAGEKFDLMYISVERPEAGVTLSYAYSYGTDPNNLAPLDVTFGQGWETTVGGTYEIITSARPTEGFEEGVYYIYCTVTATAEDGRTASETSGPVRLKYSRVTLTGFDGSGTKTDPYLIKTEDDLITLRNIVFNGQWCKGVYFKMVTDIALSADWTPIGEENEALKNPISGQIIQAFSGIFDGAGHKITVAEGGKPLFNYVSDAVIKNLDIYGKRIDGNGLIDKMFADYGSDGNYWTGVPDCVTIQNVRLLEGSSTRRSGFMEGSGSGANTITIDNCVVQKGVTIGYTHEEYSIGSFVGPMLNGQINNSYSEADVYGTSRMGGLAGSKGQSMGLCVIRNSHFGGNLVASGEWVGGLIGGGYVSESAPNTMAVSFINCYVDGNVTGIDYVGGLFGGEEGMQQCWNDCWLKDSFFYGTITATGDNVGGIIGYMRSIDNRQHIENNYFYEKSGTVTNLIGAVKRYDQSSDYGFGNDEAKLQAYLDNMGSAKTAEEFKDGTVKDLLNAGSDYKNWVQGNGDAYPRFSGDAVVSSLTISGSYKTRYKQGEVLDLDGIVFTAVWSDGRTENPTPDDVQQITEFDPQHIGAQTIIFCYGAGRASIKVSVIKEYTDEDRENFASVTVLFSLSNDDQFVTSDSATISSTPIKVTYFDLANYGLEEYYQYDESGNVIEQPTMLHLFIAAMEHYELGLVGNQIGNGSLQQYPNLLTVQGGSGHMYMTKFWNHGANLIYSLNGSYPLQSPGIGATADQLILHDGDFVDVAMFSDTSFWTDDNSGMHYFSTDGQKPQRTFTVTHDTDLTLTYLLAHTKMSGSYITKFAPVTSQTTVYYGTSINGSDTKTVTTDENGEFTINFKETGTYYLWTLGAKDARGKSVVSAPACATITVTLTQEDIDNQKKVKAVEDLIDAIGEVTENSGDAIAAAREAYDALPDDLKGSVTNYDKLKKAEDDYKAILNKKAAAQVDALIDAIGEVTENSGDAIKAARDAYNALTDEQKEFVENYDKLEKAEVKYVEALIDAIGVVTKDSGEKIKAARDAYDALTPAQRKLVGNYKTLLAAEKRYEDLTKPVTPVTPSKPSKPKDDTAKPDASKFVDVSKNNWYFDAVQYVLENGLMNGTSANEFSPNADTTRGMIVTILARLDGVDTSGSSPWYAAGRTWAMNNGISDGTNMEGKITREQLAAMLYRYAKLKGYDVSASADISTYTDASSVSSWATDAMRWAVGAGLINGRTATTLAPQGNAARAEVAAILMRFAQKIAK